MPYNIKDGYRHRRSPSYFVDTPDQAAACQPDVYAEAAELASVLGARTVVDLGCGIGDKLATLASTFDVVGVDHGANLEKARARHPEVRFVEWDLEQPGLVIPEARGAMVLCIDVIEHMRSPERLLRLARSLLDDGALAFVLTTPERDLVRGPADTGPPANESHVREWNHSELNAFLQAEGLSGNVGLTRSNTSVPWFHTTLAVIPSSFADLSSVAAWWERRDRYVTAIHELQLESRDRRARERHLIREITDLRGYVVELEAIRESYSTELLEVRSYVGELEAIRESSAAELSTARASIEALEAELARYRDRFALAPALRKALQRANSARVAFRERLSARRG